jgi:uncharacterized repeat protein (TIGR01451 family)
MKPANMVRSLIGVALTAGLLGLPGPAGAQISGADLSVSKTGSPDPVAVGADLTYTITVRNDGPLVASGVIVADTLLLPTLEFVTATPSQGTCTEVVSGVELLVTCSLGDINSGATATVTLVTRPKVAGALINVAAAVPTPPALDPNPLNNVATESTTVTGGGGGLGADLAVSKADAPDPIRPGAILSYTVTVQNLGGGAATDVILTDVLPPTGATFISASTSQGSCGAPTAGLIMICSIGGLANGASATVQIQVRPTAAGTLLNTATAVATSVDPNPVNNVAIASTTVDPNAPVPGGPGGGGGGGGGGGAQGLAACTIMGTPLADILVGTAGNDVICGLDGNDRMTGLNGKDTLLGGNHNDRGNGGKGLDVVKGQSGKDRLRGAAKKDRLAGGGGKDRLAGGGGNDRLAGGPAKDRLNGGAGRDRCQRGKGDKLIKCP